MHFEKVADLIAILASMDENPYKSPAGQNDLALRPAAAFRRIGFVLALAALPVIALLLLQLAKEMSFFLRWQ
jgi:hypothetical protein